MLRLLLSSLFVVLLAIDTGENSSSKYRYSLKPLPAAAEAATAVMILPAAAPALPQNLPPTAFVRVPLPPAARQDRAGNVVTAAVAAAAAGTLLPLMAKRATGIITIAEPGLSGLLDEAAVVTASAAAGAASAEAADATAAGSGFSHTRSLLSDASLTDYSDTTVTVTPATPEAANTGTLTIIAPRAETVRKCQPANPLD